MNAWLFTPRPQHVCMEWRLCTKEALLITFCVCNCWRYLVSFTTVQVACQPVWLLPALSTWPLSVASIGPRQSRHMKHSTQGHCNQHQNCWIINQSESGSFCLLLLVVALLILLSSSSSSNCYSSESLHLPGPHLKIQRLKKIKHTVS
jgi:hypothetical protein